MNVFRRGLVRFATGFPIGMLIGVLLPTWILTKTAGDGTIHIVPEELIQIMGGEMEALLMTAILSGLLGGISMGFTAFYLIDRWSLLRSTLSHMVISVVTMFTVGILLKWWDPTQIAENLLMAAFFLVAYTIIWLSRYLSLQHSVKDANDAIQKAKDRMNR